MRAVIAEVIQQDTPLPADEAELLGSAWRDRQRHRPLVAARRAAMPIQDAVRLVTQLSWGGIRDSRSGWRTMLSARRTRPCAIGNAELDVAITAAES